MRQRLIELFRAGHRGRPVPRLAQHGVEGQIGERSGKVRRPVSIHEDRIRNNTIGAVIDAGFPHRAVGTRSDPRLSGSLDVTFRDNDLAANLWTPALVTFTRNTAALIPSQLSPNPSTSWKYQNSVFQISDPQNSLAGYWLDHPETDPIDRRTLNNVLTLNAFEIRMGGPYRACFRRRSS